MTGEVPAMRAAGNDSSRRWMFGDAVFDDRTLELTVRGRAVELERKSLEVLRFFLANAGRVVTKQDLLDAVWPGRILSETVLTKAVSRVREAIGDVDQSMIKTVHGYGYRLVVPVSCEPGGSAATPVRRLTAIMFTDIVGYTTLMGRDEVQAIAARDRHRAVVQAALAEHGGRWIEEIGDESLSVFDSALDAARCASTILRALADGTLRLRIGLHIGEVLEREGRLFGDAVNVAARIRAEADPGATVVSERLWEELRNHPELRARPLGERTLKNVDRPVRLYVLDVGGDPEPLRAPRRRRLAAALLIGLAAAVTGAVAWRFVPPTAGPPSIAVLPFVNISPDPANEYFSDGMTEELITALAKVEGLHVPSRTSVFRYKGQRMDLREIGHELNVQSVLEGSVRKEGAKLRVTAQLINVADGYHLWSQTYERTVQDVFAVQDDLAKAIVAKLRPQLMPAAGRALADHGTDSLEAYDAYLRGRYSYVEQDEERNRAAIASLQEAVAIDPGFARAHAALAEAYHARIYTIEPADQEALKNGVAAAERAVALDPDLAEAHLAHAQLLWIPSRRFPHETAIRELRLAVQLNPRLANAWRQLFVVYTHVGLFPQAEAAIERAIALDPHDMGIRFQHATLPMYLGRWQEGLVRMEAVPRTFNPTIWYAATSDALLRLGRTTEAVARIEEFSRTYPDRGGFVPSVEAMAHARAGRFADAEAAIARALAVDSRFGHYHHATHNVARAYALMGRSAEALRWLEYTAAEGFPCHPAFAMDSSFTGLREDPGFNGFLDRSRSTWLRYHDLFPPDAIPLTRIEAASWLLRLRERLRN